MKSSRIVAAAAAVLLGLSLSAAADEKADKVIKELDEQYAKIKAYSAKTKSTTDVEFTPEYKQKSEMVGMMEWARQGDKAMMHSVTQVKTVETQGGSTTDKASTITAVSDGEFMYVMTEEAGQKTVMKNKAPSAKDSRPSAMFAQLREYFEITLLDDAKVDGADCHVIEMKMKPMEGMPPQGRQLQYYSKDHGMMVKTEAFDGNGKLTVSSITTDIKIDADISPDRFKFEIPPDAQVTDMSVMQQPGQTQEPDEQP